MPSPPCSTTRQPNVWCNANCTPPPPSVNPNKWFKHPKCPPLTIQKGGNVSNKKKILRTKIYGPVPFATSWCPFHIIFNPPKGKNQACSVGEEAHPPSGFLSPLGPQALPCQTLQAEEGRQRLAASKNRASPLLQTVRRPGSSPLPPTHPQPFVTCFSGWVTHVA